MIRRAYARWLLPVLALALLLPGLPARADTAIAQFQTFRGPVNFVGTQKTMRTSANSGYNSSPCSVTTNGVSAKLSGVPTGADIKSAQLYWAGSGSLDSTVTMDGQAVTAGRTFTSSTVGNGFNYFSGAADVTRLVKAKINAATGKVDPNATYTFSGLAVSTGSPWCNSQGVVGGFALVVVYSHPDEPFRLLNLYEGFKYFQNSGFVINLGNFNVPNPLPAATTGRIGHITWEGDSTLSQGGENLLFNTKELTDTMNPSGNQFNSASNANGDYYSYGIDFDIYSLDSSFITAGQNSASTTYRSGSDLVLLSAEVVAMPFVGNADLGLSMSRTGDLRVGATATYTLTVTNYGDDVEIGPVTIVDTLPAGLKLVSTSGSGWSCTSAAGTNSTTRVTCTRAGLVESKAVMTPLTLTVTPSSIGNYTNTATVSGKTGDGNAANNSASNTSTAIDLGSAAVIFTTEVCKNGDPLVTAPGDVGCHRFIGPVIAGASDTKIYVTATGGNKAMAIDSYASTLQVDLAANCKPFSNVALTYAGQALDCQGGWKTVTVTVPAGSPTGTLPGNSALFYADVGRVSLSLRYQGVVMGTVDFISRPLDIRFQSVFRSADNVADQLGTVADSWKKPSPTAFAKAGEQFTMRLGALMADKNFAPSFGKEAAALKGVLPDSLTGLDFQLDLFAANPLSAPVLPVSDAAGSLDEVVQGAFALDQGFTLNASIAGAFDARARWFEAGYLAATPYLSDYLGTGQVGGPPDGVAPTAKERMVGGTRVIGHFYPDHFETQLAAAFSCTADMKCPETSNDATRITFPPNGAVYSTQPFTLSVKAFGLPRDGTPQPLALFRNLGNAAGNANANLQNGVLYRNVGLAAVVKPNDTTSAALTGLAVAPALQTSSGPADFPAMATSGSYTLGKLFSASDAASGKQAPTLFYLRASMTERVATGPSTTKDIAVSSTTPISAPATQYEDGLMVVSGRLLAPNVFGSELLRLPVKVTAQYWNGKAWTTNTSDSGSTVADTITPLACTRSFATTGQACKASPIAALSAGAVPLVLGSGLLTLQSPGRGTAGSVDFTVSGGNAGAWLPSTRSRATFGVYKSPLIYMREVY